MRKPRKQNNNTVVTLREFKCDLSTCVFSDLIRLRAPWFDTRFELGVRIPTNAKEEWDFRGVKPAEEAREAVYYEYGREVEWIYCYHAQWLAGLVLPEGSNSAQVAAKRFKEIWCQRDGGCPDPFFAHIWMMEAFPMPWALVPTEWRKSETRTGYGVHSLSPAEFGVRNSWTGRYRTHAIEIDWSMPQSEVEKALARWAKENRPQDVPLRRTRRGKRVGQPFQQLKWLAASRLAAIGLSYKAALQFLPTRQVGNQTVGADDPHGVLPVFASQGAWATAVSKARELIRTNFFDPRLC